MHLTGLLSAALLHFTFATARSYLWHGPQSNAPTNNAHPAGSPPSVSGPPHTARPPSSGGPPSGLTSQSGGPRLAQRNLSQNATNGASLYGTPGLPPLAGFMNGPIPGGYNVPWGNRSCENTNPYQDSQIPDTGVTRKYCWTVTNTTMAPDGVEVPVLAVNNQFPGPLIEANWGDWIEVEVINGLETEGTSMHWHGFLQHGTPWFDGVPGITQCPIAPGDSFTYRFRAELYGTTWWHSHSSAQYLNGLVGPIVVHGPKTQDYDIDLGPIMLTDWYHNYYINLVEQVFVASEAGPVLPPMSNNMLIQGKSDYPCENTTLPCTPNAGLAHFNFQSGKKHLLRLINHGAEAVIFFSIDNHNLTVIANDFVAVQPYQTDLVVLAVGQRTDIIVEANGAPDSSTFMRITEGPSGLGPPGQTGCSLNTGVRPAAVAPIYYEKANNNTLPTTTSDIDPSRLLFPQACANQPLTLTTPQPALPVEEPDVTLNFVMTGGTNATGDFVWWMNNITFFADWNDPVLLEAKLNNLNFPVERAFYNMKNGTVLRINMTSVGFPASHPMHIHGHNMQILNEGNGFWDGTIVNPSNPQRRDTQLMRPNGFLVVQFALDNPGTWMFHCHIAWHISEGNGIVLGSRLDALQQMSFPGTIAQGCRNWSAWTGGNTVKQIDSGL